MRITIIFLLCLIFVVLKSEATCKDNNEYCQNHWECCSNSCLSYLYRCVGTPKKYFAPFNPLGTFETQENKTSPTPTESLNNLIYKIFSTESVAESSTEMGQQNKLESRVGTDDNLEKKDVSEFTTSSNQCLEIGKKCYHNSECCTKRCHGFLHQCVS